MKTVIDTDYIDCSESVQHTDNVSSLTGDQQVTGSIEYRNVEQCDCSKTMHLKRPVRFQVHLAAIVPNWYYKSL